MNGKPICSSDAATTIEPPKLHISQVKPTTDERRTTTTTTASPDLDQGNSDDEFFAGDFSPSRRPIITVLSSAVGIQGQTCGLVKTSARPLITYGQSTTEGINNRI